MSRPVGSKGKRTIEIEEKLKKLKCDPIAGMAKIACDPENSPELRGKMYAELAQYVAPKRKAIEHSGEITRAYVARMPAPAASKDEWTKRYGPQPLVPTTTQ